MAKMTYHLTDEEYAESIRAGFDAARHARFVDNDPNADEVGIAAAQAKAQEIARRRLLEG